MEFVFLADCESTDDTPIPIHIRWLNPPGFLKLNTNASFTKHVMVLPGGSVCVIRNSDGKWVVDFSGSFAALNATYSEFLALLQGSQLAHDRHLFPIKIGVDSTKIYMILEKVPPLYNFIVWYCRWLLKKLGSPVLRHSFREANGVADFLPRMVAKLQGDHVNILLSLPKHALPVMEADLQDFLLLN